MFPRDKAIREIKGKEEIFEIIAACKICHVGFIDGSRPYVLAFNFGFADGTVYLHCARYGHKLDVLRENNKVCVEFDCAHEIFARNEEVACSWRMRYKSVIAWGTAEIVDDFDLKEKALSILMTNYSDLTFSFSKPSVDNILIIKIKLEEMSGRSFEYG